MGIGNIRRREGQRLWCLQKSFPPSPDHRAASNMGKETDRLAGRKTSRQAGCQAGRRLAARQEAGRRVGRQAYRQAGRWACR